MNLAKLTSLFIIFTIVTSCFALSTKGQEGNKYNFNIENGLPSNHVYSVIKDRCGYLWIATTNGVLRYNGYEFKIFTIADGLPTDDVWQLTEDSKGRIWLGCIADKIGYILNEKYYNAVFIDTNYHTIYPTNVKAYKDTIVFFNSFLYDNYNSSYCYEKNDTIHSYILSNKLRTDVPGFKENEKRLMILPFIKSNGRCIIIYDKKIYDFDISANSKINVLSNIDSVFNTKILYTGISFLKNNYIIMYYYTSKQNYFEVVDINTGKVETISLKEIGIDENIISIYHDPYDIDSNIYVITNKYIIEYNACQKIKFADKFLISNIATNPATNGEKITKFFLDPFWGNCICTNSNGFDVRYNVKNYFTKHKRIDLLNYTAVGSGSDGSSIWWNESTRTVCSVSKNYTCEYFRTSASSASKNVHTTGKRDLHIGSQNHFLDLAKRQIYETCRPEFGINKFFVSAQDSNLWYVISNFGFAISDPRLGVVSEKYIDRDRYKDLIFDSLRNLYWAYNQNKILIYDIQQKNKIVYTKKKN